MPFTYGIEALEPAFEDRPVPYIAHGTRFHDLTAANLEQILHANRVFLIVSASLAKSTSPALSRLQRSIERLSGTKLVGTHIGISSHTPYQEVIDTANEARTAFGEGELTDRDVIVTLGGGSITDAAKVIAWVLANPSTRTVEDLDTMYCNHPDYKSATFNPPVIRVVTIPTTLSGGEYQSIAGVTKPPPSNEKHLFTPPARNPSLVILDPELTITTPLRVWLSSGVRAIDHCVETLTSLHSNPQGDEAAEAGLKRLVPSLLLAKKAADQQDAHSHDHKHSDDCRHDLSHESSEPIDVLDARFESFLGVRDAMSAVGSGVPLGGSHAIGHQLGPLGVPHGETSCVMLPAVCQYNAKHGGDDVIARQAICRDILIQIPEVRKLLDVKGKGVDDVGLGDVLDLVIRGLGMPRTLKDVGVEGEEKISNVVKNTLNDKWAPTNAVPLKTEEQLREIMKMV